MCFCKYKERKRDKKVYIQNNLSEIHAHNRKVYIPNTGTYIPAIWDINFAQYPEKDIRNKQNKKKLQSPKHALENLRSHLLKPIYIKQAIYCITTF